METTHGVSQNSPKTRVIEKQGVLRYSILDINRYKMFTNFFDSVYSPTHRTESGV